MPESREPFVCAACDTGMERVQSVPVLASLAGHTVHRCGQCGHILLVQEDKAVHWNAGWLRTVSTECRYAISCASLV